LKNDLVAVMLNRRIGSSYKQKRQQHGHHLILKMSVNRASTISSVASWVIYIPISCRLPFIRYWQPLLSETTATYSLPHPENDCQWSVNNLWFCKYGNQTMIWLLFRITDVLAAYIGKRDSNMATASFWECASTERQRFEVM